MTTDRDRFGHKGAYASPPCMAGEMADGHVGAPAADPQQVRDVARWRTAERTRLRAERAALTSEERRSISAALMAGVRQVLESLSGRVETVSFYWPIKDEPDLRPLMTALHGEGLRIALPLVERKAAPLVFRAWTPETRMERGHWNIPVPPRTAPVVTPDAVLAPLVGWDGAGYRLGYGGGYFDRTLAALAPRPFSIGTGLASSHLATIFPQPHDIPLDVIVTEQGVAHGSLP